MASLSADPDILDQLSALKNDGVTTVSVHEIEGIVQQILDSLGGDVSTIDLALLGELESLSAYIQSAKGDIAAIRPEVIREEHLPVAREELEAVVGATEQATEDIMAASEKIQALAEGLDDDIADEMIGNVMQIYEACSFQDITGQRVTKVLKAMQEIETCVESMLAVFGDEQAREHMRELAAHKNDADSEAIPDDPDADLLHGPQLEGGGNTQDEIDKILASFD